MSRNKHAIKLTLDLGVKFEPFKADVTTYFGPVVIVIGSKVAPIFSLLPPYIHIPSPPPPSTYTYATDPSNRLQMAHLHEKSRTYIHTGICGMSP